MDANENTEVEISLDLSKLLGFQTLGVQASETDLGKLMDDTHNKVGEVPPIIIGPGPIG